MRPCPKVLRPRCGQCGKLFTSRACGPTHAIVAAEGRPKKARKPLKRSWIKRRRPRRLSRPGSDLAYLGWLHKQPCILALSHRCERGIQASHLRHHTGLGLKEPDRNAIPMCAKLHEEWEQHRGVFKGWTNWERFCWFTRAIAATLAAHPDSAWRLRRVGEQP